MVDAPERFTSQQIADTLLALHEAAHFKACIDGDIPVDFIRAERSFWSGERTGGYNRLGITTDEQYWNCDPGMFVRMCMAGRAAEEYWLELHPGNGQFKLDNCGGDTAIMHKWIERYPELSAHDALAKARTFVRVEWGWINSLASAFIARDRMSRGQALRAGNAG